MLDDVPFDQIDLATLERLKESSVPEGRTIDYKRDEPAKDREAFLANVTSFANTLGGHLLYGVDANKGTAVPVDFPGLAIDDVDKYELRLNQMIRDNVDPRMPSPDYRWVDVNIGCKVLVIRVRQSWSAPHAAMKHGRYYQRTSNGKQPMDTHELRNAFLFAGQAEERFEDFCSGRLELLKDVPSNASGASRLPCAVVPGLLLTIHVAPVATMVRRHTLDIRSATPRLKQLRPARAVQHWSIGTRPNASGFLAKVQVAADAPTYAYCQVFRTGCIESVSVFERDPPIVLNVGWFERTAVDELSSLLDLLTDLDFSGPTFVQINALGCRGFVLQTGSHQSFIDPNSERLTADLIALPGLIAEDHQVDVGRLLRPAFDTFWNAFGKEGSTNYGPAGGWRRPMPG